MFIKEQTNNKIKLNSSQIKLALMEYFRYKKQFIGVLTEYSYYFDEIEDFVAFKEYEIAVVEIKISKSDFLKDFEKIKHCSNYQKWYSHFYFCVTEKLKDFVLEYLKENGYSDYGVLIANSGNGKPYISVARPATKKIQNNNWTLREGLFSSDYKTTIETFIKRMSSELIIAKRGNCYE